jgi:hypothetical protein
MNSKIIFILFLFALTIFILLSLYATILEIVPFDISVKDDKMQGVQNGLEELVYLGYLRWSDIESSNVTENRGVIFHEPEKSYNGINVFSSYGTDSLKFMDMNGKIIHLVDLGQSTIHLPKKNSDDNLLVISYTTSLFPQYGKLRKIRKDSTTIWESRGQYHHDMWVTEDGRWIYALGLRRRNITYKKRRIPIIDNQIILLDQNGRLIKTLHLSEILLHEVPTEIFDSILDYIKSSRNQRSRYFRHLFDVFHINTIEVIERDIGVGKIGDLIICSQKLNLIAIIDPQDGKVVWSWGKDDLDGPHHPSILENGNMLIFDNGYKKRRYSRIIELDPVSKKIVWEYTAKPRKKFHTRTEGAVQKLPNGNMLITESAKGHAFEITPEGEVVWDFWNIDVDPQKNRRRTFYRMLRLEANDTLIL